MIDRRTLFKLIPLAFLKPKPPEPVHGNAISGLTLNGKRYDERIGPANPILHVKVIDNGKYLLIQDV